MIGQASDAELTDDARWCPPLFGTSVINARAVEIGSGLVRSVYPIVFEKSRGLEEARIVTYLNTTTIIYAPSRDAC